MFAEELLAYSDSFNASAFFSCLRSMGDVTDEAGKQTQQNSTLLTTCFFVWDVLYWKAACSLCSHFTLFHLWLVAAVDKIEAALGKFSDGPFFLGQFSLVCVRHYIRVPFPLVHGQTSEKISEELCFWNTWFFLWYIFFLGWHCICAIHRKASDILFWHQELRYRWGQTQPWQIHRGMFWIMLDGI